MSAKKLFCNFVGSFNNTQNIKTPGFVNCVEHKIVITLWCLATCGEYCTIGHLFGIARCTVCAIVHDTQKALVNTLKSQYIRFCTVCAIVRDTQKALVNTLKSQYIRFSQDDELPKNKKQKFKQKWGFVQCAGAIDGSYIPVRAPVKNHTDYNNRKGWYSIIVQAVVDRNYLFCNVYSCWPDSVHDG